MNLIMDIMSTRFYKNSLYNTLTIIFLIIIIFLLSTSVVHCYISDDSGYYLKIASDLANGMSYYKDIYSGYTPMGMYILSIPFYFNQDISTNLIYVYYFLFYIIDIIIFYFLLNEINNKKNENIFYCCILFLSILILDGLYIVLEPFVLLFLFISLLFLLKSTKRYNYLYVFFSGIALFYSFFSKQYSVFAIPAYIFFLLINRKSLIESNIKILILGLGFLLPFLLHCLYQIIIQDISFYDFFLRTLGFVHKYGQVASTGNNLTIYDTAVSVIMVLLLLPYLLSIPILMLMNKIEINKNLIFIILLTIGFSMQLFFAPYHHYFQLIIPFMILLIVILIKNETINKIYTFIVSVSFALFIATSGYFSFKIYNYRKQRFDIQIKDSQSLQKKVLKNSKVYLQGTPQSYYYLCRYGSLSSEKIGYAFSGIFDMNYIVDNVLDYDGTLIVDKETAAFLNKKNRIQIIDSIVLIETGKCYLFNKIYNTNSKE
jgi:hypothetical protein